MTKVLEGTWEEVAAHADELAGRHVTLIVADEAPIATTGSDNGAEKEETLAEAIARIGTIDGTPSNGAKDGKRLWGEYVMEKHRRIKAQSEEN